MAGYAALGAVASLFKFSHHVTEFPPVASISRSPSVSISITNTEFAPLNAASMLHLVKTCEPLFSHQATSFPAFAVPTRSISPSLSRSTGYNPSAPTKLASIKLVVVDIAAKEGVEARIAIIKRI